MRSENISWAVNRLAIQFLKLWAFLWSLHGQIVERSSLDWKALLFLVYLKFLRSHDPWEYSLFEKPSIIDFSSHLIINLANVLIYLKIFVKSPPFQVYQSQSSQTADLTFSGQYLVRKGNRLRGCKKSSDNGSNVSLYDSRFELEIPRRFVFFEDNPSVALLHQ